MPVADEVFDRAARNNARAIEQLLAEHFPAVCRIAHALMGRARTAHDVIRFVMVNATRNLPGWRDALAAERWFHHHAILAARRTEQKPLSAEEDLFVRLDGGDDPAYLAIVRALRALPQQQREAFILQHGEHWNIRSMAIAMDCSTQAAEVHLRSAEQTLSQMAGERYAELRQRLVKAYTGMSPVPDAVSPAVRRLMARATLPRRIRRWVRVILVLAIAAAAAYVAWQVRSVIRSH